MATGKRYYWIKLKDSFMTSDAVDFLMGQPDGANYVVLYQMLCLKTINTGGRLERQIGEVIIPYDEEKIKRDTKWFSIDTIRVALNLYKALGLVYVDTDGALALTNYENLVGSETDWAAKRRLQRAGKALPEIPTGDIVPTNVPQNVPIDIDNRERDKEIDKDYIFNNIQSENSDTVSIPSVNPMSAGEYSKKEKNTYAEDSDAYQAACYLARSIKKNYPELKQPEEKDLQRWAADFDKCHRLDKHSWDDISDVLAFSQKNSFWRQNIRSGNKFREKYETLLIRMKEADNGKSRPRT